MDAARRQTRKKKRGQWGGSRPGAGRPTVYDEPGVKLSIQVSREFRALVEDAAGDGSLGDGFCAVLRSDRLVKRARKALEQEGQPSGPAGGRPASYPGGAVNLSIRVPPAFRELLDETIEELSEAKLSASLLRAFLVLLKTDDGVRMMREALG